jgi:integrase
MTSALDESGNPIPNWFVDIRTKQPYLIFRQKISSQAFKISTGETDLKAAKLLVNKKIKEFFEKSPEQRKAEKEKENKVRLLNADLMPLFLDEMEKEFKAETKARGTWTAYRAAHNKVFKFYREFFPEDHTPELWSQFQDWSEEQWPGQVQFNLLKYYRKYEGWLVTKKIIVARLKVQNKFKKREKLRLKRKKYRIFTREEMLKLRRATPPHLRLMFDLGFEMAFRASDCTRLTFDRCDLKERHPEHKKPKPDFNAVLPLIYFRYGDDKSTQTDISVPVSDRVYRAILRLKKENESHPGGSTPWVFPQQRDRSKAMAPQSMDWPAIRKRAKVPYGTFHTLRHTRLTLDFKNPNYTATQVMLVRRVSYEVAREHYIHVSDKDLALLRNPKDEGLI